MEFLDFLKYFISILVGAASAGVPLYLQLAKFKQELREQKQKLEEQQKEHDQKLKEGDISLKDKEAKVVQKDKINTEAEWKRIIEFRDAELVRLRERDDQQERQINTLWEKHIACEKTEAAQAERIKAQNEKIEANQARITTMETRLDELLKALITKAKDN